MQKNEIELMLMIAKVAPKQILVEMLIKACDEYKDAPSENSYQKVLFNCNMLLSKDVIENTGGIDGMMKTVDKFRDMREKETEEDFKNILKDLDLNVQDDSEDN